MSLMDLPIEEAKRIKWAAGVTKYRAAPGPFVGDPIEEMYSEIVDAENYADEAERQGVAVDDMLPLRSCMRYMRGQLIKIAEKEARKICAGKSWVSTRKL